MKACRKSCMTRCCSRIRSGRSSTDISATFSASTKPDNWINGPSAAAGANWPVLPVLLRLPDRARYTGTCGDKISQRFPALRGGLRSRPRIFTACSGFSAYIRRQRRNQFRVPVVTVCRNETPAFLPSADPVRARTGAGCCQVRLQKGGADSAAVARLHGGIVDCPGCKLMGANLFNT